VDVKKEKRTKNINNLIPDYHVPVDEMIIKSSKAIPKEVE